MNRSECSGRSGQREALEMEQTSARALVEHWNWAAGKGLMNRKTAQTLAGACRGVLGVQENWEDMDVRTLDIEDSFDRFKNLRSKDFSPNSLRDYESRFRRAVESFRDYLDDPTTWKFPSRNSASRGSTRPKRKKNLDESSSTDAGQTASVSDRMTDLAGLQEYSYPFRPDTLARLVIPRDATTAEINRLVAWARTLAVDYEPSS